MSKSFYEIKEFLFEKKKKKRRFATQFFFWFV